MYLVIALALVLVVICFGVTAFSSQMSREEEEDGNYDNSHYGLDNRLRPGPRR